MLGGLWGAGSSAFRAAPTDGLLIREELDATKSELQTTRKELQDLCARVKVNDPFI